MTDTTEAAAPAVPALYDLVGDFVGAVFADLGYDRKHGAVVRSQRAGFGQLQCNGAMACAKQYRVNPRKVGADVAEAVGAHPAVASATVAGPGFVNITLEDAFLAERVQAVVDHPTLGLDGLEPSGSVVIDFGGANVAKPLHVGHLRSAILGETLKRLGRAIGHDVIGDVHLGDWGLQMGMLIHEIGLVQPDLPYFDSEISDGYPAESPVTMDDLNELYPAAAGKAKVDPDYKQAAQEATNALQTGRPGYRALWRHLVDVSIAKLRVDYAALGVEFDLWLGESDAQDGAESLVLSAETSGRAVPSDGALVVEVGEETDKKELPPLILRKANGAFLYGTTDLATIEQRVRDYDPATILYVVDSRQGLHFEQVFRAARRLALVRDDVGLEHIKFGTMNGADGKPFKTRAGGVMRLDEMIRDVRSHALARVLALAASASYSAQEREDISACVALATLKYADLMNKRTTDYIFDPERFSAFEGKTGPYLLYATVRSSSVLAKAAARGFEPGPLAAPMSDAMRNVCLLIAETNDVALAAWRLREPHHLCEHAHKLASTFNQFYAEHPILKEEDPALRASYLGLVAALGRTLTTLIEMLGMVVPERM